MLSLPGLASTLRSWRKFDPAARLGMPPHVTLIYPFMDSAAVDAEVRARLHAMLATVAPLDLTFDRPGRFDGGVWLELADPGPVRDMISALAGAFPDWPPYGGAFADVTPHLTLAQAPEARLARIEREVAAALPLSARADAVSLFGRSSEGWIPLETFPLTARG